MKAVEVTSTYRGHSVIVDHTQRSFSHCRSHTEVIQSL